MPGSKIPVLEIEKLWLKKDGRGFYAYGDNAVVNEDKFTKGIWVSGMRTPTSGNLLPGASSMAWLKITWASGTAGASATGFIPIFSGNLLAE